MGATSRLRRRERRWRAEHDMLQGRRDCFQQSPDVRRDQYVQYNAFSGTETDAPVDRKILDMLPGRPPQVTFSCNKPASKCDFQFWVDQVESFYCALDTCKTRVEHSYDKNVTLYECEHLKCNCVADRFLCGEDGSISKFV